jgi:hypothetical protein
MNTLDLQCREKLHSKDMERCLHTTVFRHMKICWCLPQTAGLCWNMTAATEWRIAARRGHITACVEGAGSQAHHTRR